MEIFDFIDSKAIREHLKNISYDFSNTQKSFLIAMSRRKTVEEKHRAFEEIIASGKDEKIPRRPNTCKYPSLFEFLRRYMDIEKEIVKEFYSAEDSVYSYRYLCEKDRSYCEDFSTLFPSFDLCEKAFKDDIGGYSWDVGIRFYQYKMTSLAKIGGEITLKFNKDNELIEVESTLLDEESSDVLSAFEGMWFDFPTPFKKGDILISYRPNLLYTDENPVVLESLSTWNKEECIENGCVKNEKEIERCEYLYNLLKKSGDISDLNIRGYFGCADGSFYKEVSHSILDYDYYKGTFDGGYRILKVVSDYIKGELDLDQFVMLANYIHNEEELKDSKRYIHISDHYLKELGI